MNETNEHVILVAFQVTADTREEAEAKLTMVLPRPNGLPRGGMVDHDFLESWWVAEDDRRDGSDNDSAVFVRPGGQKYASRALYLIGMTDSWNQVEYPENRFES